MIIIAVRSEKGLEELLPGIWEKKGATRPAGTFIRSPDRNWIALRIDVTHFNGRDDRWSNPYQVVFHEYVHLILDVNFGRLPVWLNEGLAEHWGNTIIQGDRVYLGVRIPHHLQTLRGRTALPLERLFAVTHDSPEYSEQDRASIFYAQSWALVHYLTLGSEARSGQLDRLARALYARRPTRDAMAEALGDPAALEEELQVYIRNKAFAYQQGPATVAPNTQDFTVRPLSTAESLAVRAAFHVATDRAGEARALAEQALAEEPNLAAALEALALLAWREAKIDEATEILARATRLPGASDFAHYLHGVLSWQRGTSPKALDVAERSLMRAIERNPRFAAAYHSVAQLRDSRGAPTSRSLPPAMRASAIEPGNLDYLITALRLLGRGSEREAVRQKAEALRDWVPESDRPRVERLVSELSDARTHKAVSSAVRSMAAPASSAADAHPSLEMARAHMEAGHFEEAKKAFERANREAGGQCVPCLVGEAAAKLQLDDLKGARKAAERAAKLATHDPTLLADAKLLVGLAHFREARGREDDLREAEKAFREALQATPANLTATYSLGVVLLRLSRDEEGIGELARFVEGAPDGPNADLARTYIENPRRAREPFAPVFRVRALDGQEITLDSFRGRMLLLDFWGTWCPPCIASLPELKELRRRYTEDQLALLSVSVGDEEEAWRSFVAANEMTWLQCRDADRSLVTAFNVREFPTYLLIDGEGAVVANIQGLDDKQTLMYRLRSRLDELLAPKR